MNRSTRIITSAVAFALAALATGAASAAELVTNGSFETRDLSGWSQQGDTGFTGVQCGSGASDGACSFFAGTVGDNSILSQVLATTVGTQYLVSFSYMPDGSTPSLLGVSFGSQVLLNLSDPVASGFVQKQFVVYASAASTALTFTVRNDPGFFLLDGVSVAAVPEPATAAMCAAGLLLIGLRRARRG
jgi:hypothetical protein